MDSITKVITNVITKIIIENFQSHQCTEIAPAGPGQLTVIIGESRQGKTAILRALKWLFYNSPDGAEFIRWGATFARVTAEYSDGTQVIRYRTAGGTNRYIIQKPGEQEQVYEGFGRGAVPLEVQQITGVSPVEIGEGLTLNLNLAEQLDGPFLGNKSVSSTARAKVLGKLAGTEEVDLAGKQLGTDLYRWKRDKEGLEKAVEETKAQLAGYEYLDGFKANLDKLAGVRDAVKAAMEKKEKLQLLLDELIISKNKILLLSVFIDKIEDMMDQTSLLIVATEKNVDCKNKYSLLEADLVQNTVSLNNTELMINRTQGLSQAGDILKAAEGQFGRRGQVETVAFRWNNMLLDVEQAEKVLSNIQGIYAAEDLTNAAQKDAMQITGLIPIAQRLESTEANLWKVVWVLNGTGGVPVAESSLTELYAFMGRKSNLAVLCDKWDQSMEDMSVVEKQMKRTESIESAEHIWEQAYAKTRDYESLNVLKLRMAGNESSITRESLLAQDAETDTNKYQERYYETLKQVGKCPVCGSNINEACKDKIGEVI